MSEQQKARGLVPWPLGPIYRRVRREVRGEHGGSPVRTAFARVTVLLVVLMFGGEILWSAFKTLLPAILMVIAVVASLKLLHRAVHHFRQR